MQMKLEYSEEQTLPSSSVFNTHNVFVSAMGRPNVTG